MFVKGAVQVLPDEFLVGLQHGPDIVFMETTERFRFEQGAHCFFVTPLLWSHKVRHGLVVKMVRHQFQFWAPEIVDVAKRFIHEQPLSIVFVIVPGEESRSDQCFTSLWLRDAPCLQWICGLTSRDSCLMALLQIVVDVPILIRVLLTYQVSF